MLTRPAALLVVLTVTWSGPTAGCGPPNIRGQGRTPTAPTRRPGLRRRTRCGARPRCWRRGTGGPPAQGAPARPRLTRARWRAPRHPWGATIRVAASRCTARRRAEVLPRAHLLWLVLQALRQDGRVVAVSQVLGHASIPAAHRYVDHLA